MADSQAMVSIKFDKRSVAPNGVKLESGLISFEAQNNPTQPADAGVSSRDGIGLPGPPAGTPREDVFDPENLEQQFSLLN